MNTKVNEMTTYERRRNVDKDWFQSKLDERKMSMRALAKLMDVDPSTVSMMIRGLRGLSMENAQKMASVFSCTTNEVYKRAGLPLEDETRTIPVAMYVDNGIDLHEISEEARDHMSAPFDTPSSAYAVQYRTSEAHDGWMVIVDGGKYPPEKCVGAFCAYCDDKGKVSLGIIRRGYKSDRFNVVHNFVTNANQELDIDVLWASPVIWIKPVNPLA